MNWREKVKICRIWCSRRNLWSPQFNSKKNSTMPTWLWQSSIKNKKPSTTLKNLGKELMSKKKLLNWRWVACKTLNLTVSKTNSKAVDKATNASMKIRNSPKLLFGKTKLTLLKTEVDRMSVKGCNSIKMLKSQATRSIKPMILERNISSQTKYSKSMTIKRRKASLKMTTVTCRTKFWITKTNWIRSRTK